MKDVQFAIYEFADAKGKPRRTTYKMTPEEAAQRYPNSTILPRTIEIRRCPETETEAAQRAWSTPRRPIRLLVCGSVGNLKDVWRALSMVHGRRPIYALIHTGEAEACLHADEWGYEHDVDRIASSPTHRSAGLLGSSRVSHLVVDLKSDGVLAFPGGHYRDAIIRAAIERGIKVWLPFG